MNDQGFSKERYVTYLSQHRLMAVRCQNCQSLYLPPRPLCSNCFSEDMAWVELSGRGKLAAFTTIHIGTKAMIAAGYDRQNPYVSGIVELDEGVAISAEIMGLDGIKPEQIAIGTPLQATFVERPEGKKTTTHLAFKV